MWEREKHRCERSTDHSPLPPHTPQPGIEPPTQTFALTRNQVRDSLVQGTMPSQLRHAGQGDSNPLEVPTSKSHCLGARVQLIHWGRQSPSVGSRGEKLQRSTWVGAGASDVPRLWLREEHIRDLLVPPRRSRDTRGRSSTSLDAPVT